MSLRTRIALLTSGAVAVAVIGMAAAAFVVARGQLRSQVDATLKQRTFVASQSRALPGVFERTTVAPAPFAGDTATQIVGADGSAIVPGGLPSLPVDHRDIAVAAGRSSEVVRDVRAGGVHMRMITVPLEPGQALQFARPLTEVDGTLRGLLWVLVALTLAGIGFAALLGRLVARSALAPVDELTQAAEHVARTRELDTPIGVDRRDELGRLAASFNEMLEALRESQEQQRRLVADASHELRTPLTSLRTNVDVLARVPSMDPEERERVLADLGLELEELTSLVGELVDLATEARASDAGAEDVRLDEIVAAVVDRAKRRTGQEFALDLSPFVVHARPAAIERAVANLVDNACKWNANGAAIDVRVWDGRVEVRDRGPGIDPDDRPHIFDRFYRAEAARSMPGSGLGLAIVRQIVESHGGKVWAAEAAGGGALVGFELPAAPPIQDG